MKKIALLSLCIFCINVSAAQSNQNDIELAKNIAIKRSVGSIDDKKYFEEIKLCAKKGNKFCIALLGDFFYVKKNYSDAFVLLSEYFDSLSLSDSNKYLFEENLHGEIGWMYLTGNGVLQDYEKALYHFKVSAQNGDAECAMHVAAIYAQKAKFSYLQHGQNSDEYKSNFMYFYAWTVVAQALGYKYDNNYLVKVQGILSRKSLLSEANDLARKICSTIQACYQ